MIGSADLPRSFTIRESSHRIHNPLTSGKLVTLGRAIRPAQGTAVPDLACGSGEMLCTWARDHQVTGTGVDISTVFLASARARAAELGVAGRVAFVHGDASGYVAAQPGGLMLVGEPYWRREPPDQATVEGCHATRRDEWLPLPGLLASFGGMGLRRGGDGAGRPGLLGPLRRGAVAEHPPLARRPSR